MLASPFASITKTQQQTPQKSLSTWSSWAACLAQRISKKIGLVTTVVTVAIAGQYALSPSANAQDIPLPSDAFAVTLANPAAGEITLDWTIMDETYLYQSAFSATTTSEAVVFTGITTDGGEIKDDPNFGKVAVHHNNASSTLRYEYAGTQAITIAIEVASQGCHNIGICYPPQFETHELTIKPSGLPSTKATNGLMDIAVDARDDMNTVTVQTDSGNLFLDNLLGSAGKTSAAGANADSNLLSDQSDQGVMAPDKAFVADLIVSGNELFVQFVVNDCCYIYQDKLSVSRVDTDTDIILGTPVYPLAIDHEDSNFGKVKIYDQNFGYSIPFANSGSTKQVELTLHYQGCANQGICYPPETRKFTLELPSGGSVAQDSSIVATAVKASTASDNTATAGAPTTVPKTVNDQDRIAKKLLDDGYNALIWFFFAGLLLSLTPCIFPMIPILSGIIVGQGSEISKWRAFSMSVAYVLGMAITYTCAGVIAGLVGANLQVAFQNPWVLATFAGVFVLFALAMFDIFSLQVPGKLQTKVNNVSQKLGGNLFSVFIMGALSALIVGPCVAPPLAGALSVIASTGDPTLGGAALFVLSIGMGIPLLLVGTSAGALLPRAGGWMEAVKTFFGLLMLAVAILLLERIISGPTSLLLWGALLLLTAVFCGAFEPLAKPASAIRQIFKALGLLAAVIGVLQVIGSAMGNDDIYHPIRNEANGQTGSVMNSTQQDTLDFITITSPEELDQILLANKGKQVMVDFYADWCTYCKDFEKYTFTDSGVRKQLQDFVLVKADVTKNDAGNKALLSRFKIIAPPAIIFFDAVGNELTNFRIFKYEAPDAFLKHIKQFN